MKKRHFILLAALISLPIFSAWGQSYYHDDPQDIVIKKSIIKALTEEVNPDYLLTIENDLWSKEVFYTNIPPFPNIQDIIRETSGFRGVHDPIVFDGDKIERETGRKISDVPGTAIIVYDGRTAVDRTLNYREFQVIDGDKIWVETGKPFDFVPEGRIIVYDCLFHTVFNCGRREDNRVAVFPKTVYMGGGMHRDPNIPDERLIYENTEPVETVQGVVDTRSSQYRYDPTQNFWANLWGLFLTTPWYAKVFFLLLVLFIIHLILTFAFRDWGPSEYLPDRDKTTKKT